MPDNISLVNIQALERNIFDEMRCEMDNVAATVEIREHDAIVPANGPSRNL